LTSIVNYDIIIVYWGKHPWSQEKW